MAIAAKLKNFLDEQKVGYHLLAHHERFTSPEIAQALHVPGSMLAKVVVVNADGKSLIVAIDANSKVDLEALRETIGATSVGMANEDEIKQRFPDCEVGAMPPFGNLYDMPVVVDAELAKDEEIVFEAGNHHEAIKLAYADFDRLVKPKVAAIGTR
ncbi:MAG: aminoacyl-tRNA deacylase [Planctomycetota bacterium]|jgi:Ala-tRNA(Pro) deacylase